jgi:hypothetical protein
MNDLVIRDVITGQWDEFFSRIGNGPGNAQVLTARASMLAGLAGAVPAAAESSATEEMG